MLSKEETVFTVNIPKPKTIIKIGKEQSIQIFVDTKFNRLQKFMWKKFFNMEVEDAE